MLTVSNIFEENNNKNVHSHHEDSQSQSILKEQILGPCPDDKMQWAIYQKLSPPTYDIKIRKIYNLNKCLKFP